jgi:hypothetical protein
MLKGGCRITGEVLAQIGDLLKKHQLLPRKGYLE